MTWRSSASGRSVPFSPICSRSRPERRCVERVAAIYDKPRAITLDHEALRVLQAIGLGDFMEQAIAPHNGSHYLGVDGEVIKIFDPMPPPFPLGWIPNVTFGSRTRKQALRDRSRTTLHVDIFLAAAGVARSRTTAW